MIIAFYKREKGELVEKWRFEMGGYYAAAIESDLRREERAKKKAERDRRWRERRGTKEPSKTTTAEEIFADNIMNYNGTDSGQKDIPGQ